MIKVGFIINFDKKNWLGGFNYFTNLFKFLLKNSNRKIEPIIITDNRNKIIKEKEFKNIKYIETNIVSESNFFNRIKNKILLIIFGKNFYLEKFLINNNIKVLSHSGATGRNSKIKSFPWIPDFQELNFPDNFSFYSRLLRRINHYNNIINSTKIIVSSNAVRKDLKKISLRGYNKSCVIKHINFVIPKRKIKSINYLKKKYKINNKFFLLPNHYWVHKNHIVVLNALNFIKRKNFIIVSTGRCHDHRNPQYFNNFKNKINELGLEKYYKILGIVPFEDLCSLIFNSMGVINPSMSEGFPNSADQATLLGKIAILSNIQVHLEERKKNYFYFNSEDYKKLAKILKNKSNNAQIKINYEKNYLYLQKKFINKYQDFILKNIEN